MMLDTVLEMEFGKRDTMLTNRMIEIPFPIPNSVICSPSHIRRVEPTVNVATMTIAAQAPEPSVVRRLLFLMSR